MSPLVHVLLSLFVVVLISVLLGLYVPMPLSVILSFLQGLIIGFVWTGPNLYDAFNS